MKDSSAEGFSTWGQFASLRANKFVFVKISGAGVAHDVSSISLFVALELGASTPWLVGPCARVRLQCNWSGSHVQRVLLPVMAK